MEANLLAMGTMAVMGAAGGVWGLVMAIGRKPQPAASPQPIVSATALEELPEKIQQLFRDGYQMMAAAAANQPSPVIDLPEPDWHREMLQDMTLANERVAVATQALARPTAELARLVAEIARMNEWLEKILDAPPVQPVFESPRLVSAAQQLAGAVGALQRRLDDLLEKIESGTAASVAIAPPMMWGGGGDPPRRRLPPPTPKAAPVPMPPTPSVPAPYVGGSVVVPAGAPASLLALIQQQLQPNCPGSSAELVLSADDAVYVGSASAIGGPLSDSNYAYQLVPGEPPRVYRSSFPGHSSPLADLQVLADAPTLVHVEVVT